MSGIVGSRLNTRGSGVVGSLGTDGQILASAGAGKSAVFETISVGGDLSFGGDTFGANKIIGSNDSNTLSFETNNTTAMTINTDGSINSPVQPTFLVTHTASQSNMTASSDNTITWGTEVFDIGSNFTSNTFTAPVTGKYLLSVCMLIAQIDHDGGYYCHIKLNTSNQTHSLNHSIRNYFEAQPEFWPFRLSVVADMDASDTSTVVFRNSGPGADQEDVYGTDPQYTFFSGCLVS